MKYELFVGWFLEMVFVLRLHEKNPIQKGEGRYPKKKDHCPRKKERTPINANALMRVAKE
jgi:hypothetical protein